MYMCTYVYVCVCAYISTYLSIYIYIVRERTDALRIYIYPPTLLPSFKNWWIFYPLSF